MVELSHGTHEEAFVASADSSRRVFVRSLAGVGRIMP